MAALVLTLASAAPSAAQTGSACRLTVLEMVFGDYDVFDKQRTRSVARVAVDCSGPESKVRPRIELSTGSSQTFTSRTQRSGANVLTYNIYADQALTQIVGDGSSGTTALFPALSPIAGGAAGTVDLYGAIDARQFAPPGAYFDTVYVTLIF